MDRILRLALWLAIAASAILLVRFAYDFSTEFPLLALPFCLLVALTLGLTVLNARERAVEPRVGITSYGLLALVPLAFVASSLGCTGLAAAGCTPFCTFIKLVWIPLVAGACVAYAITRHTAALVAVAAMALVPLVPHCDCYNAANGWWIDTIGASPVCYAWGTAVSALAVSSLRSERRSVASLALAGAIVGGALTFFVGHHYFRFPW